MGTRPAPFILNSYVFANKNRNTTHLMTYLRKQRGEIFLPSGIGYVINCPDNVIFKIKSPNITHKFVNIREQEISSITEYLLQKGQIPYCNIGSLESYKKTITPIINNKHLLFITNKGPGYENFWFKDSSLDDRLIFYTITGELESPILSYCWQNWYGNMMYEESFIDDKVINSSINEYGTGSSGLNKFLQTMKYYDEYSPDGFNWDIDVMHKELAIDK